MNIGGLVVAGGQSRRMEGQNKLYLKLGPDTLLERAIKRLAPQVTALAINMSGKLPDDIDLPNYDLVPDEEMTFDGPLAGILAGLNWLAVNHPDAKYLATIPADAPFFPKKLIEVLQQSMDGGIIVPQMSGRTQHLFSLWPVQCLKPLSIFLKDSTDRKVMSFIESQPHQLVDFPIVDARAFLNINRPDDFARAQAIYESEIYE